MNRKLFVAALAGLLFVQGEHLALASSTATMPASSNSSSTTSWWDTASKKLRASYTLLVGGPTVRALSGNSTGGGTNVSLRHLATAGYRIGSKWSVTGTMDMVQAIDEAPASQTDPFVFRDPYVTFSNGSILSESRHGVGLAGYVRYYIPTSRGTNKASKSGGRVDAGNGAVQIQLAGSRSFFDGKVSASLLGQFRYRLPGLSSQERSAKNGTSGVREDYFVLLNPSLSYTITPKYDVYVEYVSSVLRHSTDSKWTKINATDLPQGINIGGNAYLGKLIINPAIGVGPKFNQLSVFKTASVDLNIVYTFM